MAWAAMIGPKDVGATVAIEIGNENVMRSLLGL